MCVYISSWSGGVLAYMRHRWVQVKYTWAGAICMKSGNPWAKTKILIHHSKSLSCTYTHNKYDIIRISYLYPVLKLSKPCWPLILGHVGLWLALVEWYWTKSTHPHPIRQGTGERRQGYCRFNHVRVHIDIRSPVKNKTITNTLWWHYNRHLFLPYNGIHVPVHYISTHSYM